MKRLGSYLCAILMVWLVAFPMTVSADMGPKPSVVIEFQGLEEEAYYVTLLSKESSTGPWSLGNDYYEYLGDREVFDKFSAYEDVDGYYFLSYMQDCSEEDTFQWTYYPPSTFKILIYFTEYDRFLLMDEVYERYAFDSYYTVEVEDVESVIGAVSLEKGTVADMDIQVNRSYDFSMELVSLLVRVVLTILIEVVIAMLFGYRNRKALTTITAINVCTQILLNVLLNVINYQSGQYAFVFHYIWMECVVFLLEAILYDKIIGRKNPTNTKRYHPYGYAAVANLVSLGVGMWIARIIPGMF